MKHEGKNKDGIADVFYKMKFMWHLSSRELRSQLHSPQYPQFIVHIPFLGESTPLSIHRPGKLPWGFAILNLLIEPSMVDQLKQTNSRLANWSREIQRDLITNSFQGIIQRCQKSVDAQGSTFADELYLKINCWYWDEWSWLRSSLDDKCHINFIL